MMINHEAWLNSALGFIRDQGLGDSFRDWCGGWPSPAAPTPSQVDRINALEVALQTMVHETTHLSPMEADGSHKCTISAEALAAARTALSPA